MRSALLCVVAALATILCGQSAYAATKPSNSGLPAISGATQEGSSLSGSTGTWSGTTPITYTYQWQRCTAAGASCVAISGATATTYRAASGDVGNTLKLAVTARNSAGSTAATSTASSVVAVGPPVNTVAPKITGTVKEGQYLSGSTGSWAGTAPISYQRQWERCNATGTSCAPIVGATGGSYRLSAADAEHTIRLAVTALNAQASVVERSALTSPVTALPPSVALLPEVFGLAIQDGVRWTVSTGEWTSAGTLSFTYRWQRCDVSGSPCTDIPGATNVSYVLAQADVGWRINVVVTATNSGGSTSASIPRLTDVVRHVDLSSQPAGAAFGAWRAGDPNGVGFDPIFRSNADGSDTRVVAYIQDATPVDVALSPDGFFIAYTTDDPEQSNHRLIRILDVRTASFETLAHGENGPYKVRWSPDGRSLVYAIGHGIETQDVSSGVVTTIVNDRPGFIRDAHILSDDREVVWVEDGIVYLSDLQGTHVRAVTSLSQGYADDLAPSPDGARVAFSNGTTLKVVNIDGSGLRTVATNMPATTGKGWSSDGRTISYQTDQAGMAFVAVDGGPATYASDGGPYASAGIVAWRQPTKADLAAYRYQPLLFFDEGEKWRPLDVERFFDEKDPLDQPLHSVCEAGSCLPLAASQEALASLSGADATIDIRPASGASAAGASPDAFESPDPACISTPQNATTTVRDCNSGPASSIYYNPTYGDGGYNYFDYWFLYRYNEFIEDNHRADWEGMTVGQSVSNPDTFDWVNFAQHKYASASVRPGSGFTGAYLRGVLQCDEGGTGSCGNDAGPSKGLRIWAFPGAGTHATYPGRCPDSCLQPNLLPEGDHGGEIAWGSNDNAGALKRLPAAGGWNPPATGTWTDWPGVWGDGVHSPGAQKRFRCPWVGNPEDPRVCAARKSDRQRPRDAVNRCPAWYGGDVALAICSPSELRTAVARGRIGSRGDVRFSVRTRHRPVVAAGRGIVQGVGQPLRAGDEVVVSGRRAADTEVLIRGTIDGKARSWVVRLPRPGRTAVVRVPSRPVAHLHPRLG